MTETDTTDSPPEVVGDGTANWSLESALRITALLVVAHQRGEGQHPTNTVQQCMLCRRDALERNK